MGGAASKPAPRPSINALDADIPVIPPVVLAVLLLASFALARWYTRWRFMPTPLSSLKARCAVLALLLAASVPQAKGAMDDLSAAGSGVAFSPVGGIATGGAYAWSRNPLYCLLVFVQLPGVAATFDSLWPLLASAPMFLWLHFVVIPGEEAFLTREYGSVYTSYAATAPRWLVA